MRGVDKKVVLFIKCASSIGLFSDVPKVAKGDLNKCCPDSEYSGQLVPVVTHPFLGDTSHVVVGYNKATFTTTYYVNLDW